MRLLYLTLILSGLLLSPSPAQEVGGWTIGLQQGVYTLISRYGRDNEFTISCNTGTSKDKKTGITVKLNGRGPPPNSAVKFILDDNEIELGTGDDSSLQFGCVYCYNKFLVFLSTFLRSKFMVVQFADDRTSRFPIVGAPKAFLRTIERRSCRTLDTVLSEAFAQEYGDWDFGIANQPGPDG